ncbi:MAG: glycosyltransferase family 2 protein [Phycisphaerae bacterium]
MHLLDALSLPVRCPFDGAPLALRTPPAALPVWSCATCRRTWRLAEETAALLPEPAHDCAAPVEWRGAAAPRAGGDRPEISIVLPAHDEAESLPTVVRDICQALGDADFELIAVDDGSRDGTWEIIADLAAGHPRWQAVRLSRSFGHQAALLAGLSVARGQAVITMDADGQHPAALLPALITEWRRGAQVVQAVRQNHGTPGWFKRVSSRAFYALFSRLSETRLKPGAADFRLLDRRAVDLVLRAAGPAPFLRGLVEWLGLPARTVPYAAAPRIAGRTKFSLRAMLRLAARGIFSFSVVPLRWATWCGLVLGAASLLDLGYIAAVWWWSPHAVPGWASTAGLVALIGGVQLACVGLLGEYVGRTYMAILGRPAFVARERISAVEPIDAIDARPVARETISAGRAASVATLELAHAE